MQVISSLQIHTAAENWKAKKAINNWIAKQYHEHDWEVSVQVGQWIPAASCKMTISPCLRPMSCSSCREIKWSWFELVNPSPWSVLQMLSENSKWSANSLSGIAGWVTACAGMRRGLSDIVWMMGKSGASGAAAGASGAAAAAGWNSFNMSGTWIWMFGDVGRAAEAFWAAAHHCSNDVCDASLPPGLAPFTALNLWWTGGLVCVARSGPCC